MLVLRRKTKQEVLKMHSALLYDRRTEKKNINIAPRSFVCSLTCENWWGMPFIWNETSFLEDRWDITWCYVPREVGATGWNSRVV